jgi:hypothetical protein
MAGCKDKKFDVNRFGGVGVGGGGSTQAPLAPKSIFAVFLKIFEHKTAHQCHKLKILPPTLSFQLSSRFYLLAVTSARSPARAAPGHHERLVGGADAVNWCLVQRCGGRPDILCPKSSTEASLLVTLQVKCVF